MSNPSSRSVTEDLQVLRRRDFRRARGRWTRGVEPLEKRQLLSAGDLDPTFGNGGVNVDTRLTSGRVIDVVTQSDGKIISLQSRTDSQQSIFEVVRYTVDGKLDTTFGAGGRRAIDASGTSLAVQGDNKILIGGGSVALGGDAMVIRLTAGGSFDNTFDGDGVRVITQMDRVYAIGVDSLGRVVAAGVQSGAEQLNPAQSFFRVARLTGTGQTDTTFDAGSASPGFADANFAGAANNTEQPSGLAISADNSITVVGTHWDIVPPPENAINSVAVARFTAAGTPDTNFSGDGKADLSVFGDANAVALQSSGKIVVAGSGGDNVSSNFLLLRYNLDGKLDTTFGGGDGQVNFDFGQNVGENGNDLVILPDDSIVEVGPGIGAASFYDFAAARFSKDGAPVWNVKSDFSGGGGDFPTHAVVQNGSRLILGGFTSAPGDEPLLARYTLSTGALDTSFGDRGAVTPDFAGSFGSPEQLVTLADGSVLVGGTTRTRFGGNDWYVRKYTPAGQLDTSFGDGDGILVVDMGGNADFLGSIAPLAGGKFVLAGGTGDLHVSDGHFAVARFNANGTPDTSFSGDGKLVLDSITLDGKLPVGATVQSDGKILLTGAVPAPDQNDISDNAIILMRLTAGGGRDLGFGSNGVVTTAFTFGPDGGATFGKQVLVLPDKKILVAAQLRDDVENGFALVRYNANGTIDNSFGGSGNGIVRRLTFAPNEGLQIVRRPDGSFSLSSWNSDFGQLTFAHYLASGAPDTNFGNNGVLTIRNISPTAAAVGDDGSFAAVYSSVELNSQEKLFRYKPDGTPDTSFGTGGAASFPFDSARALDIASDGRILAAGTTGILGAIYVARFQGSAGTTPPPDANIFISNGVLTVNGSNNGDTITVDPGASGKVVVKLNATTRSFDLGAFTGILVNANGGNDKVTINGALTKPATLKGGAGNDSLVGGGWNDVLDGGAGGDTLKGGGGSDTADYSSRTANLTIGIGTMSDDGEAGEHDNVYLDVEKVIGGSGNDFLRGSAGNNVLLGLAGSDTIFAGGGNDALFGGSGNDQLNGEGGNDYLEGQAGADTLNGGAGTDTALADSSDVVVGVEST